MRLLWCVLGVVVLCWVSPLRAWISPVFMSGVGTPGETVATANSTGTMSVTVPNFSTSGPNRLLTACLAVRGGSASLNFGCTYGGTAIDATVVELSGAGTDVFLYFAAKAGMAAGSGDVVCSWEAATRTVGLVVKNWINIDQTTPFGQTVSVEPTDLGTAISGDVVGTTSGNLVMDCLAARDDPGDVSSGAGQTFLAKDGVDGSTQITAGLSTKPGGGTITMSWAWNSNVYRALYGVELVSAP